MTFGYCRVSTKMQHKNFSLPQQEAEILSRYPDAEIVKESHTGATTDRPLFAVLTDGLVPGDLLVVTKLDRLARNTVEGVTIIQQLFRRNVAVHVLNVGLLEDSAMGRFFLTTLLAVAEMERSMIIERTQAGKELARQKPGYKEGRPRGFSPERISVALELLKTHSYSEVERMTGISKSTLARRRNE